MLDRDSENNKIFLDRQNLAPYLEIAPFASHQQQQASSAQYSDNASETAAASTTAAASGITAASLIMEGRATSAYGDEADAAAGGGPAAASVLLQRVSSLGLLSRSSSTAILGTPGGGGTGAIGGASNNTNNTPQSSANLASPNFQQRPMTEDSQNRMSSNFSSAPPPEGTILPSWRLRDRMKTVGVGLVMALNIGTDPPDVVKPHPCAKLQCWMDPSTTSRARAKEKVGERLEAQYARWQQQRAARPLKYRRALDPTVEDVRSLCLWLRRHARHERILLHYNGHGVPRPTANGEIWLFDKSITEYIPLSITDLRNWMGKPSIVVLDCSSAGILIPFLTSSLTDTPSANNTAPMPPGPDATLAEQEKYMEIMSSQWVRDTIVLCPTSENEWLPMHPDYPADIFTSCLTTPIKMALRWFVRRNPQSMGGLHPDAVDAIPGKDNDRKTPLGELNWIFTAVTDSIAWNILPKPLFQRLFRQDLLVASMFRNFLLADRILRSLNCSPMSHPPLPPGVDMHPLWENFDLAMETCLFGLMKDGILGNHVLKPLVVPGEKNRGSGVGDDNNAAPATQPVAVQVTVTPPDDNVTGPASSISSPFFSEQLTAFEVWLEFAPIRKMYLKNGMSMDSPEQLPVVLQVLLSQVHRVRALRLLRQFLELGPWAVNISLSLGIFPYVMKLLQSPEYKSLLVSIWASILAFDSTCQTDLVKDGALPHFIQHLTWGLNSTSTGRATIEAAKERTLAAFILAVTAYGYPQGQIECSRLNLATTIGSIISSYEAGENAETEMDREIAESHLPGPFRMWLCLCLANVVKGNQLAQSEAFGANVHTLLFSRMKDGNADVRAASCCALGCLVEVPPKVDSPPLAPLPAPQFQVGNAQQPLVPQQMSPNMITPSGVSPSGAAPLPLSLQPSFANAPGMGNLNWHPQHQPQHQHPRQMDMMMHQQMPGVIPPGVQLMPLQPGMMPGVVPGGHHGMLNQPLHLRPQSQPYMMQGMPMQPNMGGPNPGFMVGSAPAGPAGLDRQVFGSPGQQAPLMPQGLHHVREAPPRRTPTVYDDHPRMDLDIAILEILAKTSEDGSSVVRYEAVVAIASAIKKYQDAFLVVANEQPPGTSHDGGEKTDMTEDDNKNNDGNDRPLSRFKIDLEDDIGSDFLERLRDVWKVLRKLQHFDPHPRVSQAANSIVMFVHEILLERRSMQANEEAEGANTARDPSLLTGIDEENASTGRNDAEHTGERNIPHGDASSHRPTNVLRRVASEVSTPVGVSTTGMASMGSSAMLSERSQNQKARADSKPKFEYNLPKSEFYEWKKSIFSETNDERNERDQAQLDPLSPLGATRTYLERRNYLMAEIGQTVAARFESLAPKPPKPTKQSIEEIMTPSDDNAEDDAANTALKSELELKESVLLRNSGVKMTTMIKFHPFEDVLAACGAEDCVTIWDTKTNRRSVSFINGNPKGSRMTTATWINAASTSLFLVGCDDGSARIWDGLVENNGEASDGPPNLVSAFFGGTDIKAGSRGKSGLVCEWQQYSGTLVAGGDSKFLRCWDLAAERCNNVLDAGTETNACLTTLTSAWDYEKLGTDEPKGSPGIGPSILVGGYSDGRLKVFDIRTNRAVSEAQSGAKSWARRRRPTQYTEHNSWIVNTSFTGYGGRYEVVSGSVAGNIKIWDLRMSTSQRTLEIQRSTMTALAFHKRIPVIAAGSHAQFIKILTLDGETLRVIRYHEEVSNQRIGPVSCLEFHPYKPLLVAGATDTFVSIYSPKGKEWKQR